MQFGGGERARPRGDGGGEAENGHFLPLLHHHHRDLAFHLFKLIVDYSEKHFKINSPPNFSYPEQDPLFWNPLSP